MSVLRERWTTHQQTAGWTWRGGEGVGGLQQEAGACSSEVCSLGDWQRESQRCQQSCMGKCEEWAGKGAADRADKAPAGVTLSNSSPTSSREGDRRSRGEKIWVSSPLIVLCWGWDKVRALPLWSPLPQLDRWEGRRPDVPDSWDKQHCHLKSQTPQLKWAFT